MNTQLVPFEYQEKPVRVVECDGEPWFVAKDVCEVLDIAWKGNDSLPKIQDAWKITPEIPDSLGRMRQTLCLKEPAVYKLAFRSNKPEAEAFTDWVAETVLPQIRKTGRFEAAHDRTAGWNDIPADVSKTPYRTLTVKEIVRGLQDLSLQREATIADLRGMLARQDKLIEYVETENMRLKEALKQQ